MILNGLTITVVGMLVVFAFLVLIIAAMKLMSAVVLKFFPEKKEVKVIRPTQSSDDSEIAAVIAAAYSQS